MFGRFVDWILLIGSLVGLAVAGWWTVYAAPNNAGNLEKQLQVEAETALLEGGHDWVSIVMDGQHARISGPSPNFEAEEAVVASLGGGHLLGGGITKITSDVTSAPPIAPYIFTAEQDPETGQILLSGHVPSRAVLDEIVTRAEKVAEGRVDMQLKIGSGEPLGEWNKVVLAGLDAFKTLNHGQLKLEDSDVYLSGQSQEGSIDTQPFTAFTGTNGSYDLHLDVRGPALWSARLEDDVLTLSGIVANETQRDELVTQAQEYFSGEVRDDMRIEAGGADAWLETVRALLPGFADFQSGMLSFAPESDGFTVSGKARGSVQANMQQDLVEGDYPVNFRVETVSVALPELEGLDFSADRKIACQGGFDAIMTANTIRFQTSQATISRESGLTLDKVVAVTERCADFVIEVHGHTDTAGGREGNIVLSKARAGAVKAYMIERGIVADKLEIVGLGPDVPIADNASAAGRAANRRIEFKIIEEG